MYETDLLHSLLLEHSISKKARRTIRRRYAALSEPPRDLVDWLKNQVEEYRSRREQAIADAEKARQIRARKKELENQRSEQKRLAELERRKKLPRLPEWQISSVAAGKREQPAEVHLEDEQLISEKKQQIHTLRLRRNEKSTFSDSLETLRTQIKEEAERRLNRRIGGLRHRKQLDTYGHFLLEVYDAQVASDRAKSRAANGILFCEYQCRYYSDYASTNYRRSRRARDYEYLHKALRLKWAVQLAAEIKLPCGHHETDEYIPFILYFDLPTGQISFHTDEDCGTAKYDGEWDQSAASRERIRKALWQYLKHGTPPHLRDLSGDTSVPDTPDDSQGLLSEI